MKASIDKYFSRRYDVKMYNCAHLVCEVWAELKGNDVTKLLSGFLCARAERQADIKELRAVHLLSRPVDPCIALFQVKRGHPHVGVYMKGRVLHIGPQGVQYQPLEVVGFGYSKVRFFVC